MSAAAYKAAVSIDMGAMDKVLEIDRTSRAARIQAGVYGPHLEEQLRPHGLTLRYYPQSFEYSTLGGWIATRGAGHYATGLTHIDDMTESVRAVTPAGVHDSFRLPGSGAGPSPDRLFLGSEGALGIVTEAWMRLQDRPTFRAGHSVEFEHFMDGAEAVRAISQAGLYPANLRLLDHNEVRWSGAGDGSAAVLVLGFESADHPLDAWMARALECCRDHGGRLPEERGGGGNAAARWRDAFIKGGHMREMLTARAIIRETFETAITWDRFEDVPPRCGGRGGQGAQGGDGASGNRRLPLHPCLSRRAGALFHLYRARRTGPAFGAIRHGQERGFGRDHRRRRHHHPPPCRRARPHALV